MDNDLRISSDEAYRQVKMGVAIGQKDGEVLLVVKMRNGEDQEITALFSRDEFIALSDGAILLFDKLVNMEDEVRH